MPKTIEIAVNPKVIEWAIYNSDCDYSFLIEKVKNLDKWIKGEKNPTLKQLGDFSKTIHIPFGYLLAKEPPEKPLFSADYRTIKDALVDRPSRALVETLNDMEQKMLWMRDYRISIGADKLDFIGLYSDKKDHIDILVDKIRELLELEKDWALALNNLDVAYNKLKEKVELTGVLVMKNSIVLSNTSRKLDINEFRAFTLYDEYAPLIFLNGQDSKAGRIFSIIHEYCHLLINADDDIITSQKAEIESCCNKVAANFLMPGDLVLNLWNSENDIKEEIKTLADKFKVSQLAMAKRLYDYKKITYEAYKKIYDTSVKNFNISKNKKGDHGGNYYFTKKSNLSTEFVKAVLTSTKEGKTLYTDAYRLLNISKPKTFAEFSKGY